MFKSLFEAHFWYYKYAIVPRLRPIVYCEHINSPLLAHSASSVLQRSQQFKKDKRQTAFKYLIFTSKKTAAKKIDRRERNMSVYINL